MILTLRYSLTLPQIVKAVGGVVARGGGDLTVTGLKEPQDADESCVTFLISSAFKDAVRGTKASIIVVQQSLLKDVEASLPATAKAVVASPDAYLGLARLTAEIAKQDPLADWPMSSFAPGGVSPEAHVDPSANVIPGATVCAGARIGARTAVMAGAVIGPACEVGADCMIFPGAVLYPRTKLGDHVRIHANAVIGADGFGYAKGPAGSEKIWHLGRVVIGNNAEIGAGSCIDRGTLRDSIVEDAVKVDNLVQVGHNGHLKAHSILCSQAGLAGNVTVGMGAILAGQAGIADKVRIGDGAIIGPQAGISKDVPNGTIMMGVLPARPRKEWWRLMAHLERLPEFMAVAKANRKENP